MDTITNINLEQDELTEGQIAQLKRLIQTRCIEVKIEGRWLVFMAASNGIVSRVGAVDFLALVDSSSEYMSHDRDTGALLMLAGLLGKALAGVQDKVDEVAPAYYPTECIRPIDETEHLDEWARLRDPLAS